MGKSDTMATRTMPASMISVHRSRGKADRLLSLALAVMYAGVLASLPLEVFKDRGNYLTYASAAPLILERYISGGPLTVLANEPVWLLLNSLLGAIFSPETVVRLLIFFPAGIVAWLTLQHRRRWMGWALLFLLFPAVIKNHIIHLRQGVAIALFLLGWYARRRQWRWTLWLLTPFIHVSFFFVLAIYTLVHTAKMLRLAVDLRTLVTLCAAIAISLSLPWLASKMGARQAFEYNLREVDVSGLGFLFWSSILIILFSQGRTFLQRHSFEVAMLVFYLGTYFLGAVSARIYESALLLVLLSGLQLEKYRRAVFLVGITGFVILDYYLRLGQPWLGWGF